MVVKDRVEPEVAEVPDLEEYVAQGLLIDALTTLRAAKLQELLPAISMFWVEEAARRDDFPKTFVGVNGRATASLTLKKRTFGKSGLPKEDIERLGKHGIPMQTIGAGITINKDYVEDQHILARLSKLVAANPDAGIPPDFFSRVKARAVPDEDAILRVLRLPNAADAVGLLDAVATVVISKSVLEGSDTLRKFAGKVEEMLALPEESQAT